MILLIRIKSKGNFEKTEKYLKKIQNGSYLNVLERYAQQGVDALASATPVDTGLTANSWSYEIHRSKASTIIYWTNSNLVDQIPVAILLQYGHATRNGGYVLGRDFINPAIRPIFDKMANEMWKEVTS